MLVRTQSQLVEVTAMTNPVQQIRQMGQAFWYDNIRRGIIESGELQRLIDLGLSGLTSNPTIFEKAIAGSTDYDHVLPELMRSGMGANEIYELLTMEDIRAAADLLRSTYERTGGADGYASLEVSPHLARDTEGTIAEAKRLFAAVGRSNVMIKVPGTAEGMPAVRRLIGEGINVNVTLIFSLDAYRDVREAYVAGLEDLAESGGDLSKIASVASFFVSRVDTAVDGCLQNLIDEGREELRALLGKAAVSNAKLAYRDFKATFGGEQFVSLREEGARVQRPLWASTSTKNPAYSDVMYVESLIGRDTVNTMPETTLMAFLEHGVAAETLEREVDGAERSLQSIEEAGIRMDRVAKELLADGVQAFADSFDQLIVNLEEKCSHLLARAHKKPDARLGRYRMDVEDAIGDMSQRDVVGRIWRGDHTVWKPDPEEIVDRLGWLRITDTMRDEVGALETFAQELVGAGIRNVVLLGMGGSSLGAEAIGRTFGSVPGYPEHTVLDSTVPDWIRSVTDRIEPGTTLFLVSSKSGSTLETNCLYQHFRNLTDEAVGVERAGHHFAAITDPGTPLESLARDQGFRRVFLNPPDIGGRYSVLSYYGLVPAALAGVAVRLLLERADLMRESCGTGVPPGNNPGAWLGAVIGTMAGLGRDKLTLVTSPSIEGLGLWIEQLVAESTGKEGRGTVPVVGEPLLEPAQYSDDRLFIYLRMEGDENSGTDADVERVESSGQPVVRLELRDRYDLGAEFYRWEFATAVAGAVLGVQPFDQPDVQVVKDLTSQALDAYEASRPLPVTEGLVPPHKLLAGSRPGDYLAIMAYVWETPAMDEALLQLRRRTMERYRIATTLGYGPRHLHSTGQLHKGGPGTGLFLQITTSRQRDVPIHGRQYSFGALADAQTAADLEALLKAGRRVARVRIDRGDPEAIRQIAGQLLA